MKRRRGKEDETMEESTTNSVCKNLNSSVSSSPSSPPDFPISISGIIIFCHLKLKSSGSDSTLPLLLFPICIQLLTHIASSYIFLRLFFPCLTTLTTVNGLTIILPHVIFLPLICILTSFSAQQIQINLIKALSPLYYSLFQKLTMIYLSHGPPHHPSLILHIPSVQITSSSLICLLSIQEVLSALAS